MTGPEHILKPLLTADALKHICVMLHPQRAERIAKLHSEICPKYGINTGDILHEFLANEIEESNEFNRYEENLNYSCDSLIKNFSRARISTADAFRYGRAVNHPADQKAIANIIYGGEWGKKNLWNVNPGDGWLFRGSGPIQITGRGNVTRFGQYMEKILGVKKTPEEWATALRTSDEYGIHSACWLFAISKQLIDEAIADQMLEIVKKINGGLNGLPTRMKYYELCKKWIV